MDNPWSSPWTTTDDDAPKQASEQSAAVVFPTSTKFDIADSGSPWAEGDSFGDWSVPEGQNVEYVSGGFASGTSGLREDGAATKATNIAAVGLNDGVGFSDHGPDFALPGDGWGRPTSLEDVRSPSADPWAAAASFTDDKDKTSLSSARDDGEQPLPDNTASIDHEASAEATPTASPRRPMADVAVEDPDHEPQERSPGAMLSGSEDDAAPQLFESLPVKKHRKKDSTASHTNGVRQASKVQELVHMYDGIAKATVITAHVTPSGDPRRMHLKGSADAAESTEWSEEGDVETSVTKVGDELGPLSPPSPISPQSPISPESPEGYAPPQSPATRPIPRSSVSPAIAAVRPSAFEVDLGCVSRLFDGLADVIIPQPAELYERFEDDFGSISERKAWYRMSRHGSSRMHDFGDDENYARVTWHDSAVSQKTFQIVRRWMEEGSIAGRHMRGPGLGKAAATFGWDHSSSSDPVDLSLLTKRKPQEAKDSNRRISSFSTMLPPPPNTFLDTATPPTSRLSKDHFTSPTSKSDVATASASPPPKGSQQPNGPIIPAATPKANFPSSTGVANSSKTAEPVESDSDEEWGDMVSSPAKEAGGFGTALPDANVEPRSFSSTVIEGASRNSDAAQPSVQSPDTWRIQPGTHDTIHQTEAPLSPLSASSPPQGIHTTTLSAAPARGTGTGTGTRPQPAPVPSTKSMKSFAPAQTLSPLNPARNQPTVGGDGTDNEDEVVKCIVSSLPDLSYMLR